MSVASHSGSVAAIPYSPAETTALRPVLDRLSYWQFLLVGSLGICLITLYFFCPLYFAWPSLYWDIPLLNRNPEIHRAQAVLSQLHDPWVSIDNPSNAVLHWRRMLPLLGHTLGLSPTAFLAFSFLGCWPAAAMLLHVLSRELGDRKQALCGTATACAGAWFFTSTGWLSYNDAWVVLALTTVVGIRSRWALAIACLLTCWIDERFLAALPAAAAMRGFLLHPQRMLRDVLIDVVVIASASLPYVAARLVALWNQTDPVPYAQIIGDSSYPASRYLAGAWAGLRVSWIYVAACLAMLWNFRPRWWVAVVELGVAAAFCALMWLAGDVHRSASAFLPVAVAGMVLLHRRYPTAATRLLPIAAALSLALPADHVITSYKYPIFGFCDEVWRHTSDRGFFQVEFYSNTAAQFLRDKEFDQAATWFDYALAIDPENQSVKLQKAFALAAGRRFDDAVRLLDALIAQDPRLPQAYFIRGKCREAMQDLPAAVADYESTLQTAPIDWGNRAEVEQTLRVVRANGFRYGTEYRR